MQPVTGIALSPLQMPYAQNERLGENVELVLRVILGQVLQSLGHYFHHRVGTGVLLAKMARHILQASVEGWMD